MPLFYFKACYRFEKQLTKFEKSRLIFILSVFHLLVFQILTAQVTRAKIDSVNAIPNGIITSNPREFIPIFSANIEDSRYLSYDYGEAKSLQNLGLVYYLSGKPDKSAECYLQAIQYFEQMESPSELAKLYGEFGYQLKRRDFMKAKTYMHKGIQLAEDQSLDVCLCGLYDNYGVLFEMEEKLDSAQYFYQKALDLKTEMNDSLGIPYSLNNLAGIEAMRGNYITALNLIRQSDTFREKEKGNYGRIQNLIFYGEIYSRMGNLDSAINQFKQCLTVADTLTPSYHIQYCYEQLSILYERKHDYKNAFLNQQKFMAYSDSVLNIQTNAKVAELEIAYETEKKDRQIAQTQLKIRQKTDQQIALVGFIILLIVLAFLIVHNQRLKTKQIQKELEYQNQMKHLEMEKRLSDEKIRISRELHDNIGSQLTFMIGSLDTLSYAEKRVKVHEKLDNLSRFGKQTMKELRDTIWAMKQEGADISQLVLRLNELKRQIHENIGSLELEIVNQIETPFPLNATLLLNLYRIVQEAVQNVIKYANATHVEVVFQEFEQGFEMRITDNGRGFDLNQTHFGSGLTHMRNRCEDSQGLFQIKSTSKGTQIICKFIVK
ncbi:hypothetical protein EH221_07425 [bacterium]|nr:MAG: hypothetical protein EH221_07425 [bacterium]